MCGYSRTRYRIQIFLPLPPTLGTLHNFQFYVETNKNCQPTLCIWVFSFTLLDLSTNHLCICIYYNFVVNSHCFSWILTYVIRYCNNCFCDGLVLNWDVPHFHKDVQDQKNHENLSNLSVFWLFLIKLLRKKNIRKYKPNKSLFERGSTERLFSNWPYDFSLCLSRSPKKAKIFRVPNFRRRRLLQSFWSRKTAPLSLHSPHLPFVVPLAGLPDVWLHYVKQ